MAILPFKEKDYYNIAKNRVTLAWESKPIFDRYLKLIFNELFSLQGVVKNLKQLRYIDTASGKQLDLIGIIVGQDRVVIDAKNFPYFGYEGAPEAQSYGTLDDQSVGGYYWDINKPKSGNVTLNDEQYRLFIKSKITKNTTNCTPEQVIAFIKFMYNVDNVVVTDGNMEYYILIGKILTPFEKAVINFHQELNGHKTYFIPKPSGVRVHIGEFTDGDVFAFEGVPNSKGYSSLSQPEAGGIWTTLINEEQ